jgi:Na+-transporting methylmalonyl-CoA/oxaloacetate decarboxylase gamma subunit
MIGRLVDGSFVFGVHGLQFIFAVLLLALGIMVAISGVKKLAEKTEAPLKKALDFKGTSL